MPRLNEKAKNIIAKNFDLSSRDLESLIFKIEGTKYSNVAIFNYIKKIKQYANNKIQTEIDANRLIRPEECSKCGSKSDDPIQAHHEDYLKPLDIIWLCVNCHKALHIEKKKKLKEEMLLPLENFLTKNDENLTKTVKKKPNLTKMPAKTPEVPFKRSEAMPEVPFSKQIPLETKIKRKIEKTDRAKPKKNKLTFSLFSETLHQMSKKTGSNSFEINGIKFRGTDLKNIYLLIELLQEKGLL